MMMLSAVSACTLFAQWQQVGTGLTGPVTGVSVHAGNVFVSTNVGNGEGVYRSTDNGANFTSARGNLTSRRITALFSNGTRLFAGRAFQESGGFQYTTDGGITWLAAIGTGWTPEYHFINGSTLYASGLTNSMYYSTNSGSNWTFALSGLPTGSRMSGLASIGTHIFLSYYNGTLQGIYRSTSAGQTWTRANSGLADDTTIAGLAVSGNFLLAFTFTNRVYRSTDNGVSWALFTSTFPRPTSVVRCYYHNNTLFAALRDSSSAARVYSSVDGGATWISRNEGSPATTGADHVYLAFDGVFGYLGSGQEVYRRPISQLTSVQMDEKIPNGFLLEQNYPNPFNPTTTIRFRIPETARVTLRVFDATGREVAMLTDEQLPPGIHEKRFDATGLASGVYLCRLTAGPLSMSRKLMILR